MSVESFEVELSRLTISTPRPVMTETTDKLAISTPTGPVSAHQEESEPKAEELHDDVPPGSNYLPPTPDMCRLGYLDSSDFTCEVCGYHAPHRQLMMLHSRRHSYGKRRVVNDKLDWTGREVVDSQMVAGMRRIKLDVWQPRSQEAAMLSIRRGHVEQRMRRKVRLAFYNQRRTSGID